MNSVKQVNSCEKCDEVVQRKFLHDLATPLATALLLADSLLEEVQERVNSNPDDLSKLADLYQALEKINTLLAKRRTSLAQQLSE